MKCPLLAFFLLAAGRRGRANGRDAGKEKAPGSRGTQGACMRINRTSAYLAAAKFAATTSQLTTFQNAEI
ncbi:MAG: hypothetical protein CBC46_05400 [Verrucomicrobiaceae bacterium TMED86]|nr:MAG: hypothetical protein CBC46_05400 [Verrucomicrobiaceae bacterium TMED86]